MLQQTRTVTVVPYFENWVKKFPDWKSLAEATEDAVLTCWQGLGYYSRARSLHKLAQEVIKNHANILPFDSHKLKKLPGVGDYTASAIRVFAFNLIDAPIDANLFRLFSRLSNFQEPIQLPASREKIYRQAIDSLPKKIKPRVWFSALMDLAATVCLPKNPKCTDCPLSAMCKASEPNKLPIKITPPKITKRSENRAFYLSKNHIYLQKSTGPHWKGMWILPLVEPETNESPIVAFRYFITRYEVTMNVFSRSLPNDSSLISIPYTQLQNYPLPSPHRKAITLCLKILLNQPQKIS